MRTIRLTDKQLSVVLGVLTYAKEMADEPYNEKYHNVCLVIEKQVFK